MGEAARKIGCAQVRVSVAGGNPYTGCDGGGTCKFLRIKHIAFGPPLAPAMVHNCLPAMTIERRRHLRCQFEAPLRVWSIASGSRHACRGQCVNLTEAGVGAIIAGPWLPGQVVTIELVTPGGDEMAVPARLCHRNPVSCGFEFLGTDGRVREQLRGVCANP